MAKHIELLYDETETRAVAELHAADAPKTCAAIWAGLEVPMRAKGIHAMFAGREIMIEAGGEPAGRPADDSGGESDGHSGAGRDPLVLLSGPLGGRPAEASL